jgi:hypothetical protein
MKLQSLNEKGEKYMTPDPSSKDQKCTGSRIQIANTSLLLVAIRNFSTLEL